jgi:hypothetical protein
MANTNVIPIISQIHRFLFNIKSLPSSIRGFCTMDVCICVPVSLLFSDIVKFNDSGQIVTAEPNSGNNPTMKNLVKGRIRQYQSGESELNGTATMKASFARIC